MAGEETAGLTIGEVTGALQRRWKVVALFVAGGILAGGALVMRGGGSYTAEAHLVIDPVTTDPFNAQIRPVDAVNPTTEISVMLSSSVAQEVIERLELDTTVPDLLGRVEVENPAGSLQNGGDRTLIVNATAASPERSAELADEFARVYLDQRRALADDAISETLTSVEDELQVTGDALVDAIAAGQGLASGSFEAQQNEALVTELRSRIADLEERRSTLKFARISPGRITRVAVPPSSANGMSPLILMGGAVMASATAGAVVALLLDRRGGVVRDVVVLKANAAEADVRVIQSGPNQQDDLADSLGGMALFIANSGQTPAMGLVCSTDRVAPTVACATLVQSLVAAGRSVLVVWTGHRSELPAGLVGWPVLEALCDGSLGEPPVRTYDGDLWVIPDTGVGASPLAKDHALRSIQLWADKFDFDTILFATPSPHLQPAVATTAREVESVLVCAPKDPRRADYVATVNALHNAGVSIHRVLVLPEPPEDDG